MRTHFLNDAWKLHEAPLCWNIRDVSRVLALEDDWLVCDLPCDVRMPLIKNGIIKDPVLSDYSFASEWVEKRSWWFVREFDFEELGQADGPIELCIESIDALGEVFLNGDHIGTHRNAFYPFVFDIKNHVRKGRNVLCVRVTTGLESVSDEQLSELYWAVCHEENNGCPERGDYRRAYVRKPQYCVGWDWGPKVVSCGIAKGAYIRCFDNAAIRGVNLITLEAAKDARLRLTAEVEQFDCIGTADANLTVTFRWQGDIRAKAVKEDILLTSGVNYIDVDITVSDVRLWWPSGYGGQPLYDVMVELDCEGKRYEYPEFKYGVRTVELDTSRAEDGRRRFAIVINGVPIFSKGGNWIPSDSIYSRVSPEKYDTLVLEAKNANFNMLRVWGGGLYETDVFYEACDRYGILLWHDFMFACTAFPDHQEWFRNEVEYEIDYQTKRLRTHPSLCLWCGNNEVHSYLNGVSIIKEHPGNQYGLYISNYMAKNATARNCPQIPYWNGSPYGGKNPGSDCTGDVHHWGECMMNSDVAKRIEPLEYDKVKAGFVSEYGYPGPCSLKSIQEYFDGSPIDRNGKVWELHNNTFEKKTVRAGIEKHYMENAENLDLKSYLLYAGMVQSLMLGYSLEALRFKGSCSGALFWMYNDTWGEVGWTIIDYYLRRKISYYGVKRAFESRKLILRKVGESIHVMGMNDTDRDFFTTVQIGFISFDGRRNGTESAEICIPARSRICVLQRPLPREDLRAGIFAVIPNSEEIAPARLHLYEIKQLKLPEAELQVTAIEHVGGELHVTVTSDIFIHGLYFDGADKCSDNYFELFPGQVKTVSIADNGKGPITIRVVGSEIALPVIV